MEIFFILMAPARPENVGAAARALKTMGFSRLRIVASDVHLRPEADWVAHGAQELLQQAMSFPTLPEALADRIFYPLVSGRAAGSGLGLTLSQTFVQQHQGLIECHSQPGRTAFRILIPLP